ncbi:X-ray repair cross-complementing protein 5-like [Plodia interpunctella]|uniref:X-ray repair cross-complementing protein 5-like n=1 Tax=Plodia interpunctella TaxID=58824 RepID=UPI0023676801|nr:X-ray repair cross-complementing protein 5-like [Plodia interpunctella]
MTSYRKVDQATVIILDIGDNVSSAEEKNKKSFFDMARECAARVLERKIMAQTKELVGIMLLGTKKANNNMAETNKGLFKHVTQLVELKSPTWDMIHDIPDMPSKSRGDWIDSLIVAADHLKNGVSGYRIASKKIILMTNFQEPHHYSADEIDQIIQGLKEEEFQLDIIGPDIYLDSHKSDDWQLARQLLEVTNGATATFEFVQQYLLFHKKRIINSVPRNVDLSIGPNIRIPVSAYIRIRDEPAVKSWQKAVKDPVGATPSFTNKGTIRSLNMASTTEGILREKQNIDADNQAIVTEEQIITGYHFGQEIVPFPENNTFMTYNSGHKCLSIYGFTNADNIQWQSLDSNGLSYVFGRKGDKKAQKALRCLVECLHEMNLVGIARSVYREGSAPQMFVLMPVIDTENYICLSMIGICYKEQIKYMAFSSTKLKKYEHTNEQVNAFKDLIRAMDLTSAYDNSYDDTEAFPIAQTVSPTVQYVLDSIAYRAMNPGKPLLPPRDDIMILFKTPPLIEKKSREPLDKLKTLFTLNKIEKKTRDKKKVVNDDDLIDNDLDPIQPSTSDNNNTDFKFDMPKVHLTAKKTDVVEKVGTLNPINNFSALLKKVSLVELAPQMCKAIEDIFYCNFDGVYGKAVDTLKHFREKCVEIDPTPYNEWLTKYKKELISRQKQNIISLINEKNLGFIIKEENPKSIYERPDSHEESQLYDNDTVPEMTDITIPTEVEDLFADV